MKVKGEGAHFFIALVDLLVHHGEDGVHLAERLHDGGAVGCFLHAAVRIGGCLQRGGALRGRTSSRPMPVSRSSIARLYACAAIALSEALSAAL